MINTDPNAAQPRADLTFLRRRASPAGPVVRPAAAALTDFVAGRTTQHPSNAAPTPADAPTLSSSLDLTAPTASPAIEPPVGSSAVAVSPSLDLSAAPTRSPTVAGQVATPAASPTMSSSLDLSAAPPPSPAPSVATRPTSLRTGTQADERVKAGQRTVLTPKRPSVTLTRTQSAIGTLTFELAMSAIAGNVRLGCAHELRSGVTSTVQLSGGNRFAPPHSRHPVLVVGFEQYERISVDLRQNRDLRRLALYAFSESRQQLTWGGTVIATTFGGAKIEAPLETLAAGEVAVLMSLYNVGGEFVLRAELQTIIGSIREACRAFGYDRITWLDDRTPVD